MRVHKSFAPAVSVPTIANLLGKEQAKNFGKSGSYNQELYVSACSGDQNVYNVSPDHLLNTSSKVYLDLVLIVEKVQLSPIVGSIQTAGR